MKKYSFIITCCTIIFCEKMVAKSFSEALSDFVKSEQEILTIYSQADGNDRPAFKRQMLRAGIAPEQIQAAEQKIAAPASAGPSARVDAPQAEEPAVERNSTLIEARKNLKPIPPAAPKAPTSTEIAEADLAKARQRLRKTTPNAPKTFDPLPGKPREQELQDAKLRLKKTGLLDN